ncbi:D-erythrulose reductase-like protein, partial [Leptotrombidium deliense]
PFDLLVNNAAVFVENLFGNIGEEEIDKLFSVNVKAMINITQEVAKGLIDNKKLGCSIVNVSSRAEKVASKRVMVYGATKAAVDQITRILALELGVHQIRVNAVNPRAVLETEMDKKAWNEMLKSPAFIETIPLHRLAQLKDVVNTIVYLLSDKAFLVF